MSLRWRDLPWSVKLTVLLVFPAIAPLAVLIVLHGLALRDLAVVGLTALLAIVLGLAAAR